jgi:hypothetical protein
MKLSVGSILALLAHSSAAFAPLMASSATTRTTSLSLFGGGNKDGGGGGGKGMMDQLAMFKKAQEMAQKKNKLDEELKAMNFQSSAADGKVTASFKYIPVSNPMDPNPDYEAISFDFDDAFYEAATPEELAAACQEAVLSGVVTINEAVAEKYSVLQADLMAALGGGQQE